MLHRDCESGGHNGHDRGVATAMTTRPNGNPYCAFWLKSVSGEVFDWVYAYSGELGGAGHGEASQLH